MAFLLRIRTSRSRVASQRIMAAMRFVTAGMGDGWRRHAPKDWIEGRAPRTVELDGGDAKIIDEGSGPPLVLLPPLPGFKEAFAPSLRLLARSFRVVAPDLRARFAPGLRHADRWSALVRDLETLCRSLGLGRVAVAGHSLGGALAQHWALAHPERIRALVLSSSFARVTTPRGAVAARYLEQPLVVAAQRLLPRGAALALARRLARRGGWVYDPRCDDPVLDLVRHAIRACPPWLAADRVRLALAHDTRARLPRLSVPARLLVGETDTPFARVATGEMARLIPGARIEVAPGAGHLHPMSHPVWFADRVRVAIEQAAGPG
jgi:aminoacrylate hydrolase